MAFLQGYTTDHRYLDKRKCRTGMLFFVVFFSVISFCSAQFYRNCQGDDGKFTACTPAQENILITEKPTVVIDPADATCKNTDQYIPLGDKYDTKTCVDHSPGKMVDENVSTWWQSATWPIDQYEADKKYPINVTLSLNKKYRLVANMSITWTSGRPQNMVIEKSSDYGKTWTPLQYYARDCATSYPNVPSSYAGAMVVCDEQYSQDTGNPVAGSKVIFPGATTRGAGTNHYENLESMNLLDFMTFTDLRFRLFYPATDALEYRLNTVKFMRYYYAISDLDIFGSCYCNLHASGCISDAATKETVCDCKHNTEGKDCERCKPLYNKKPWTRGSFTPYTTGKANECEMCDCNQHASNCTYNATLGYGVCTGCQDNTAGPMCAECVDGFYQNPNMSIPLNSTDICQACDCENIGLADPVNNVCIKNRTNPNVGQCVCKAQVKGRRCDQCVDMYYGFLNPESMGTCKPCACNQLGTLDQAQACDQTDGQCPCKLSTDGRQCDMCKHGYYQFPVAPTQECLSCGCDPGGSSTAQCNAVGMCTCIPHISGVKCRSVDLNYYIPALDEYQLQPSDGCAIGADLWTKARPFDGMTFATCMPDSTLQFVATTGENDQFQISWPYYVGIRYTLEDSADWTGAELTVSVVGLTGVNVSKYFKDGVEPPITCSSTTGDILTLKPVFTPGVATAWLSNTSAMMLDPRCSFKFSLRIPAQGENSTSIRIDSLVLMPALNNTSEVPFRSLTEHSSTANYTECIKEEAALATRDAAILSSTCNTLLLSVAAEITKEAKPCECDVTGTDEGTCNAGVCTCSPYGGQCACKPGVGGRKCDACLPGYYNMTATGCKACQCVAEGSMNGACNDAGQCPCRPKVATNGQTDTTGTSGSTCSACLVDHYGFGSEDGCKACGCIPENSNGTQCAADGQCPCKETIGGKKCDACAEGFFGLSGTGCQSCGCSPAGSTTSSCDATSGNCDCKANAEGSKCDACKTGFFNLAEYNPKGCQPCFCFNKGVNCTSADGFKEEHITAAGVLSWNVDGEYRIASPEFIGDRRRSYGQVFSFDINLVGDEDLSGVDIIVIDGGERRIGYKHTAPLTAGVNTISVRLFPENLRQLNNNTVDGTSLYMSLVNVTRIAIRTTIGGVQKTVSSVSMTTAVEAEGATAATDAAFVESCTCSPSSMKGGLSCEKCITGYQLNDPTAVDIRFEDCKACSCGGRTEGPRECDQVTGICLNCRNGTMGDHCENCSSNVGGVNCDTCIDNFWGLSRDGCQECACMSPGSVVDTICDKDSGQCQCVPNVVGRQCNECKPNFHTLTETGCSECTGCYYLVMEEANKLQSLLTNLSDELVSLKVNDSSLSNENFIVRVSRAGNLLNALLTFLSTATTEEAKVESQINQFNASSEALMTKLNMIENTDFEQIIGQQTATGTSLPDATAQTAATKDNIKKINTDRQTLVTLVTSLNGLREELMNVSTFLSSLSTGGQNTASLILTTVTEIENLAKQALNTSQMNLQKSQELIQTHQATSQEISKLKNVDRTMETLSNSGLSEAQRIRGKSQAVYDSGIRLQTEQSEIGSLSIDFTELNQTIQTKRLEVEGYRASAEVSLDAVLEKRYSINEASSEAAQHSVNTDNILKVVETLSQRATTAEVKAEDAKLNSAKVFTDAQNMLDIVQNFTARAQEIENRVNAELANVTSLITQSESVSTRAQALMTSMANAQHIASIAQENAARAKTTADAIDSELDPILTSANDLKNRDTADVAPYQAKVDETASIETNSVNPANAKCQSLQTEIASLDAGISTANSQANTLKDNVQLAQTEASQTLNTANNLPTVDIQRIEALRTQVTELQGKVVESTLTAALNQIKADYDAQTQWLNQLKNKKASLKQQLEAIRSTLQLITVI